MKKILLILLFPSIVFAMDTPIIFGCNNSPPTSGTRYTAPTGCQPSWNASESIRRLVIPTSGTIYNLKIADSSSTTGNYTYTLYKNGNPTSLTCDDSGVGCQDLVNTVSVSPGDTISLQSVANSPDALFSNWQGSLMFNSTTSGEGLIMGATSSNYGNLNYPIQSASAGNATLGLVQAVMPTSGTIDNLYVDLSGAPGTPGDGLGIQVSIMKNGAGSGLGVTILEDATSGSDTNAAHAVSFSAGDLIAVNFLPIDGPTASIARWGVRWRPDTDGESVQLYGSTSLGTSSSTQYQGVSDGVSGLINSSESLRYQFNQTCTVKKLYADVVTAVGAGNSVSFTVMAKQTPSALTCTISGAVSTTCNDTSNSFSQTLGDTIDMKLVKSAGMPAGDGVHTGVVTFITPPTPTPYTGGNLRPLVGVGQ